MPIKASLQTAVLNYMIFPDWRVALATGVSTSDGLRIGATKEDLLNVLRDRSFRYQNSENEVVGILFLFETSGKVSKIILFSYV